MEGEKRDWTCPSYGSVVINTSPEGDDNGSS